MSPYRKIARRRRLNTGLNEGANGNYRFLLETSSAADCLGGKAADQGLSVAFVFGNEKTGLSPEEHALCAETVRIPIAADQPSLNLAQAAQILAYELFTVGLERRS